MRWQSYGSVAFINCDPHRVEEEIVNLKLYCSGEVPVDVASRKEELVIQRSGDTVSGEVDFDVVGSASKSAGAFAPPQSVQRDASAAAEPTAALPVNENTSPNAKRYPFSGRLEQHTKTLDTRDLNLEIDNERAAAYFRQEELFLRRPLDVHSLRVIW